MARAFMDGYRTYDTSGGHGSPDEWREAFGRRMGLDEATGILGDDNPWDILGLQVGAAATEIKKAWRMKAMRWHPDRNGGSDDCAKMFIRCQAAYIKLSS